MGKHKRSNYNNTFAEEEKGKLISLIQLNHFGSEWYLFLDGVSSIKVWSDWSVGVAGGDNWKNEYTMVRMMDHTTSSDIRKLIRTTPS